MEKDWEDRLLDRLAGPEDKIGAPLKVIAVIAAALVGLVVVAQVGQKIGWW